MIRVLFCFVLLIAISCRKNGTDNRVVSDLPQLIKIVDSTVSISKEDKTFFFYSATGNCDSIVYQTQISFPPSPLAWTYVRERFEYNIDSLPVRVYKKQGSNPEELYSSLQYNNAGKITKQTIYTDTFKFSYDTSNRLIRDTQINMFGNWYRFQTYTYDSRDNVIENKTFSRYSPDSGYFRFAYDNSINPLHYAWNILSESPDMLSLNNRTSYSNSITPPVTTTYLYNSYNLPVKAYIYNGSQPEPVIRTYFYQ
jgi:hypothetical protein